jgi:aspartate-semialdehyde dehydrogenase
VGGHSESVNVEFSHDFDLAEVRQILSDTPGVVVQDDTANADYPMPLYAEGKDEVLWAVSAATKPSQIRLICGLWLITFAKVLPQTRYKLRNT